jgi:hypothetical protein
MFTTYFHNAENGKTESNGTTLGFATKTQLDAENDRVRSLPWTKTIGRLSHAIATDENGFREIVPCSGRSAELIAAAAADTSDFTDIL